MKEENYDRIFGEKAIQLSHEKDNISQLARKVGRTTTTAL